MVLARHNIEKPCKCMVFLTLHQQFLQKLKNVENANVKNNQEK